MLLYPGKNFQDTSQELGEKIVMELCDKYLDVGRKVITDNYYTGVLLAIQLLDRGTHLLGTLRKNRKGLPVEVTIAKLIKREVVGKESKTGFVVGKRMDKRQVHMFRIDKT
ncbi:Transposase IS4 [Popillia japonica]|uniref:Transposase IS4 n=1 Tax=Popillia japonica TaxID=7064 RepID=A0AAW1L078_POPJA